MSELVKRILFAVPAGVGFIAITWLGHFYLAGLLLVLLLVGQYEIHQLASRARMPTNYIFLYLFGVWVFSIFWNPSLIWAGLLLIGLLVGVEIFLVDNKKVHRLPSTLFWGIYGPLGFGAFLWIRSLGSDREGFALALSFLLMVWLNDILAYLGGKYFGSNPLAADISPNKTWEGFLFGIAGAIVGLFLTIWVIGGQYPLSLTVAVPMAILSGFTGPLGDLTQSRLKRVAQVKDSSNIFPGHGGVWDRFDAMVLTTIVLTGYIGLLRELALVTI